MDFRPRLTHDHLGDVWIFPPPSPLLSVPFQAVDRLTSLHPEESYDFPTLSGAQSEA